MARSVIVYGPQGCGKTFNREAIMAHFGLGQVIEDLPSGKHFPSSDCLVLTNRIPTPEELKQVRGPVFSFDEVMRQMKASKT